MAYVTVDVNLDDVLNNLNTRELEELANALIEDGYGDIPPGGTPGNAPQSR